MGTILTVIAEENVVQITETDAYNLPCKYIIHTVGSVWQDGKHNEKELLSSSYQNVLETARGLHIRTIGLSSISKAKGFPES